MVAILISALAVADLATAPIRVEGDGYLRFAREGETVYAKKATLTVKAGKLAAVGGPTVLPAMLVEGQPDTIQVDEKGHVIVYYGSHPQVLGRLALTKFPDDIRPVESRGFLMAYGSGVLGDPAEGGFGKIVPDEEKMEGTASVRLIEEKTGSAGDSEPPKKEGTAEIKVYAPDEDAQGLESNSASLYKPDLAFLQAGGIRVVLPEKATVDGRSIFIGAVATVYANAELSPTVSAVDVGTAPVMGVPKIIDADRVKISLIRAGFDAKKIEVVGSSQCEVSLKGQTITHVDFLKVAIEAAKERFGDFDAESNEPGVDLEAPEGTVQIIAENVIRSGNVITVRVVAYVDGKRINSRTLKIYNASVPVHLRVGSAVKVLVKSNDVSVETTGKVKKIDGITGDITVELDSGITLVGQVNKQGFVEVSA